LSCLQSFPNLGGVTIAFYGWALLNQNVTWENEWKWDVETKLTLLSILLKLPSQVQKLLCSFFPFSNEWKKYTTVVITRWVGQF
jgi:hypothetical protein